jgi:hypothetical protein
MEATGAPPPAAPQPEKAGAGLRILAVFAGLVLGFAAAIMIAVQIDIGGAPRCDDPEALVEALAEGEEDCYEGSSTQKVISLVLGWPSAILAALACLAAFYFAARGLRGRLVIQLAVAAIVLGALSILIGSI